MDYDYPPGSNPDGAEFVSAGPRSRKVVCTVCGRKGYPHGSWKQTCLRGHKECRNRCGTLMGVLKDGSARRHASHRCPALNPKIKARDHA